MEKPLKGDVVVLPFPFSDLTTSKRRPALVLANAGDIDLILAQITSRKGDRTTEISLNEGDFHRGKLSCASYIRATKLFTGDSGIVLYKAGSLKPEKISQTIEIVCRILKEG